MTPFETGLLVLTIAVAAFVIWVRVTNGPGPRDRDDQARTPQRR